MNKIRILALGPKEYPFGISAKQGELPGGGADRLFFNLSSSLANSNIEFHLIVQSFSKLEKEERINDNLVVYRVPWIRGKYRTVSQFFFAFFKSFNIKFNMIFTILEPPLIFGFFLSKLRRKKLVTMFGGLSGKKHGLKTYQKEISLLRKLNYFISPKSDLCIFASNREREDFENSLSVKLKKTAIIPTGTIDRVQRETSASSSKLNLLFLGRLEIVKGLDILIESVSNLADCRLLILGTGREENNLKKLVVKKKLVDRVHFFGFRKDIDSFFKKSDIFILPSRSEGTPNALIEAMSSSVPIIASDLNYDEIKDGYSALTFKSEDIKDLTNKIKTLSDNPNLRSELSKNAFKEYKEKYTNEKMGEKFHESVKSII